MKFAMLLAAVLAQTGAASPAPPQAGARPPIDCSLVRVALPRALAGWQTGQPLDAGAQIGLAPVLPLGKGSLATLKPGDGVRYIIAPEKAGEPGSFGGLFSFTAPSRGRYRVALGGGAWIDVVSKGKRIASVAHGHGPQCTGVRKMVDFVLPAGPAVIQIAGSASETVQVMVVRTR